MRRRRADRGDGLRDGFPMPAAIAPRRVVNGMAAAYAAVRPTTA
jgi:hypothetical protein